MRRVIALSVLVAVAVAVAVVVIVEGGDERTEPTTEQVEKRVLAHPPSALLEGKPARSVECRHLRRRGYFECEVGLPPKSRAAKVLHGFAYDVEIKATEHGYEPVYGEDLEGR